MVTVASSIPLSVQGNQVLRDFYDMVLAWPGHGAGERNSRQGYTVCVAQSIS